MELSDRRHDDELCVPDIRSLEAGGSFRPLGGWLVTITDLSLLLLCFFLMLNAAAPSQTKELDAFVKGIAERFGVPDEQRAPLWKTAAPVSESEAMNLDYLAALLRQKKDHSPLFAALEIERQIDRLVLSLPPNRIFEPDGAVSAEGGALLGELGALLERIDNRIAVEDRSLDWEASLKRARLAARALRASGYADAIDVLGSGAGLHGEKTAHALTILVQDKEKPLRYRERP